MGRISRGWALTQQSWRVLKSDMSLVIFPILSTIFAVLATVAIWAPALLTRGVLDGQQLDENDPVLYVAGVATAYVSTFIAIFFNVALAACAVRSMRGEDTKVTDGIKAALSRIGPILGWTLVTTTVGLLLKALEERLPQLGRIAVWLAGAVWAVATFFVVPVVALEGGGPFRSLRRSAEIVKARWGEGATGAATIAVVTWVAVILILISGAAGAVAFAAIDQPVPAVVVAAIAVLGLIVVSLISSALNQVFRVAVYQYAVTGQTPGGFDGALLANVFRT